METFRIQLQKISTPWLNEIVSSEKKFAKARIHFWSDVFAAATVMVD